MKSNKTALRWIASLSALALGAVAAPAFAQAHDEDFLKRDIAYFQERSVASVHARLLGAEAIADSPSSDGRHGYRTFRVRARALETFKGAALGEFSFDVALEQPGQPPEGGDYILNLSVTREGVFYLTDDSVGWIRATPALLASARTSTRKSAR